MIISEEAIDKATLSANLTDVGTFTIKESSKAFKILSSTLYSNKIRAIVRELACNARDSHTAAGYPERPINVTLPTHMNPVFEVKDTGLGLSHSEVMNLYTTYFDSTKTNSNSFVGALGLGSKSPFSYTDNFVVESVYNDEKNSYSAFINDNGVPSIVRMSSCPTDEPNGVTVSIAVNRTDFDAFVTQAKDVFSAFDVVPIANGPFIFDNVDVKYPFNSLLGCRTYKTGPHYIGSDYLSYVRMGGVLYPVDAKRKEFYSIRDELVAGFVVDVGIGDVEPLPSREGLSYSKSTIETVLAKFTAVRSCVTIGIDAVLDSKESDYTKLMQLDELVKKYNTIRSRYVAAIFEIARGKINSTINVESFDGTVRIFTKKPFGVTFNKTAVLDKKVITDNTLIKNLIKDLTQVFYSFNGGTRITATADGLRGGNLHTNNVYVFYPNNKDFDPVKFSAENLAGYPINLLEDCVTIKSAEKKVKTAGYELTEVRKGYTNTYKWVPVINIGKRKRKCYVTIFDSMAMPPTTSGDKETSSYYNIKNTIHLLNLDPADVVGIHRDSKLKETIGIPTLWDYKDSVFAKVEQKVNKQFGSLDNAKTMYNEFKHLTNVIQSTVLSLGVTEQDVLDPKVKATVRYNNFTKTLDKLELDIFEDLLERSGVRDSIRNELDPYSVINVYHTFVEKKKFVDLLNFLYNQFLTGETK